MLTGGVAKYVAWLMNAKVTTKAKMLRWVTQAGSPYFTEGTELIKRQRKKFNPNELADKVSAIEKDLAKYDVKQIGLSMEDM